jgi:hypothetical protein
MLDVDVQRIVFDSEGSKFIQISQRGFMCKYDFDRCTGIISNPDIIYPEQTGNFSRYFWSGAYSPDDSKFYISTTRSSTQDTSFLFQFDLSAINIPASCDTLGFVIEPVQGGTVRLAPDGKIYYSCFYDWGFPGYPYPDTVYNQYNMNLGVINYPDSLGAACDYQPFSFYLGGKRTYYGLPNNPKYELGPVVGSACDTIVNGIASPKSETAKLYIFFHSGWNTAFVNAEKLKGKTFNLRIVDLLGKEVYAEKGKLSSSYFTSDINCSHLAGGVYILTLETDKEIISKKFVRP